MNKASVGVRALPACLCLSHHPCNHERAGHNRVACLYIFPGLISAPQRTGNNRMTGSAAFVQGCGHAVQNVFCHVEQRFMTDNISSQMVDLNHCKVVMVSDLICFTGTIYSQRDKSSNKEPAPSGLAEEPDDTTQNDMRRKNHSSVAECNREGSGGKLNTYRRSDTDPRPPAPHRFQSDGAPE